MPNVTWPEGSFVEIVKAWQSGWLYITEPRDTNWAATPEFRSIVPMGLTSWKEKGLAWGSVVELTGLQTCVQNMIGKEIKLVNVVQVMLVRRILPCQRRVFNLWEFVPAKHQTLRKLYGMTHKDACSFSQCTHGGILSYCVYLIRSMWRRRSRSTVQLHCQKVQQMLS